MERIPFSRPDIGDEEIEAVTAVLRSGWLTTGAQALAFEQEFATRTGAKYALAVNSATAGLHLALEAAGVGPGTTVVVPSLTFTATAEVAHYLGAQVAFADIDPDTLLIDAASIDERCVAAADAGVPVSAIIPVHFAGAVCDMAAIRAVARRYGAAVIEDAAHAFPCRTPEGYAGTLGTVGVYSFYANKTITTGEGGMICTNDERIAARIRTMRLHGIDRESWDRYQSARPGWYYQVVAAGYKYNMTDIAASMGRVQLRRADELHQRRREIARRYHQGLAALAGAGHLVLPRETEDHAWHLYVVRVLSSDRDALIEELSRRGIGTSVHYIPLHQMPYWSAHAGVQIPPLPRTTQVAPQLLSLPLFPGLAQEDQRRVIAALAELLPAELLPAEGEP